MDNKIKILSIDYDNVIESRYITAKTNYEFSIAHLIPLIKSFSNLR